MIQLLMRGGLRTVRKKVSKVIGAIDKVESVFFLYIVFLG